jgi:hypothetical protein
MGDRHTLLCELAIMYKSIISQDRFWIIPSDVEWDAVKRQRAERKNKSML